MSEQIVLNAVEKLTDPLIAEYSSLQGVSAQTDLVKIQLGQMQCFLRDAESKQKGDARTQRWVRDVREVAFEIEDAIDAYLVDIHNIKGKHVPLWKRLASLPAELIARRNLGSKISHIQAKISMISEIKETLGIKNLGKGGDIKRPSTQWHVVPDVDNDEVVGFEVGMEHIISALFDGASSQNRRIISIVGPGGLGKTTLAHKVYNNIEVNRYFNLRVWLSISQDFKPIDVLRKLYEKATGTKHREVVAVEEYLSTLNWLLRNKRYLIILDDVWSENVFAQLEVGLPDIGNGSRVIMTTRSLNVASLAEPTSVFELPFLSEEKSLELFLKNALRVPDPLVRCPNELLDVAKNLANRCGGLPLALVVLGRLVSTKPRNCVDWFQVAKKLDWYRDGEICMNILATSYDDLPYFLKSCFRYLACFPEDYKYPAKSILKMWIAEGFMMHESEGTWEDAAERCLQELVQRCLVQAVERDNIGFIDSFRVHDLLRDLAIHEAKENDFLLINKNESIHTQMDLNRARRAVIHEYDGSSVLFQKRRRSDGIIENISINMPNIRSFFQFDQKAQIGITFTFLRVLELQSSKYLKKLPEDLNSMIHLRYLGLAYTELEHIPETVCCLQNLQTLDIWGTRVSHLPSSLWEIQALRHVHVGGSLWEIQALRHVHVGGNFLAPPPQSNLVNLHTLKIFNVPKSWREGLPCFNSLRDLALIYRTQKENEIVMVPDWRIIISLLGMLNHLVSLQIQGDSVPVEIADVKTSPSYQNLRSLFLGGSVIVRPYSTRFSLDAIELPRNLTELRLRVMSFDNDPMPNIEKLPFLRYLWLSHIENVDRMVCSAGGFPQLQILHLYVEDLSYWKVEEGAMPMLKHLTSSCRKLSALPDLKHITTLQELELRGMSDVLRSKLEDHTGEEWEKIQHVAKIQLR